MKTPLPLRQGDLVLLARGTRSRAEFAKELRVHRTGVWRYEKEKLGVPPRVLNHCLGLIAQGTPTEPSSPLRTALEYVRLAAEALRAAEAVKTPSSDRTRTKRSRRPERSPRVK